MKSRGKKFIGVDFDGTLSTYDKYIGAGVVGDPIPLMVARIRRWLSQGKNVKIFTARVASEHPQHEIDDATKAIKAFCKEHIGAELDVTAEKSPNMYEFWDDKAITVEKNTGIKLTKFE